MICLLVIVLSGCVSVQAVSDYCLIAQPIIPTNIEIDKMITADVVDLLLKIDAHDTRYEELCK